ncbi:hypothetical protein [Geomesophilobacter sediminis]|uniref:Uncharacterized protein n=1 Tax=Geomesophilobacter sediminis TaxID=2798584 RepID=A0A8J7LYC3_9BACT|nr:hypothetical protein [Geomesophilobacter sediminis]MBJ6724537.1 hypothetical protein [Geomesophilobacter sediminis]
MKPMRRLSSHMLAVLMSVPLVLLMLQVGIALLHQHHDASYYDNDDQFHYVSGHATVSGSTSVHLSPAADVLPFARIAFVKDRGTGRPTTRPADFGPKPFPAVSPLLFPERASPA